MKKIKLSENLELSQVVMGCMRIADSNLTENELLDLVEKCLDMGVTSMHRYTAAIPVKKSLEMRYFGNVRN